MAVNLMDGYALGTSPIASGAITTDTAGLETREVRITSDGFEFPAYVAHPERGGRFPMVLVVQEIFGVHEYIRDICRRLAKLGYYAVAPELYARQGNPGSIGDMQELIREIVSKVPDSQVLRDLDKTVDFAHDSGKGDAARLGICGFCWGGRIVWLYSAHQSGLKAGAAWYGKLVPGPYSKAELQPRQPLDVAGELHGPVLGLYGGKDDGIPLADVEMMQEALRRTQPDQPSHIVVYPEAGHAFHADYRSGYHADSARDAWTRMLDWFKTYGVV